MNFSYTFEKLKVYNEAKELVVEIYKILNLYPDEERYALCNQMRRSAISITSNIAEGTSRSSLKDKIHFIEIAFGSLMELLSQIQIPSELKYIENGVYQILRTKIYNVSKLLSGLRSSYSKTLNSDNNPTL